MNTATKKGERMNEVVVERVFEAPRERVWAAWTDPEQYGRWWGPKDFTSSPPRMDFRVGGKYVNVMVSPEGKAYWGTGIFREIVPLERLVFTDRFADADGNAVQAASYGFPDDFPMEMLITVTLEDAPGGRTRLTLTHSGLPEGEHSEGTAQGWRETLDKLAAVVEV